MYISFSKRSRTILTLLKGKQADACLPPQFLLYPARKLSKIDARNPTPDDHSGEQLLAINTLAEYL